VIRRATVLLLLLAMAASACSGGGTAATSAAASGPPVATKLPPSGTVRLPDGITYTVAAPGQTLALDNLSLRIDNLRWTRHIQVPVVPPGTTIYAVFTVTVTNTGDGAATLGPTQVWVRNDGNRPFLAAGRAGVPRQLVGSTLPPGQPVRGRLVYPLPGKITGGLLVYGFGELPATAKHVGIARYD
jgi:hypothetical protein